MLKKMEMNLNVLLVKLGCYDSFNKEELLHLVRIMNSNIHDLEYRIAFKYTELFRELKNHKKSTILCGVRVLITPNQSFKDKVDKVFRFNGTDYLHGFLNTINNHIISVDESNEEDSAYVFMGVKYPTKDYSIKCEIVEDISPNYFCIINNQICV